MGNLEKLKDIIKNSSLSENDKLFWEENIIMPAQKDFRIAESFVLYLDSFPNDLKWVTDFSKRKLNALKSGNKDELDKILKEEEEKLNLI